MIRRGQDKVFLVLLAAAAVLLVASGAFLAINPLTSSAAGVERDLEGRPVALEPADELPASERPLINANPDTGVRFTVPSVGLDVPLGELSMVNGAIVPPGFTAAYKVRNLGVPLSEATKGTVYVTMHSLRNGGRAPGNYLIDVATGHTTVPAGATVAVGSLTYSITESKVLLKADAAKDASLWTGTPKRLVVITCLQRPDNSPSTDNLILIGSLNGQA